MGGGVGLITLWEQEYQYDCGDVGYRGGLIKTGELIKRTRDSHSRVRSHDQNRYEIPARQKLGVCI
jgi:hypothetical protein